ncbi:MAG: hypothetical protein AMXMBFR33_62430 [Candidatus Xenobia bacterium]
MHRTGAPMKKLLSLFALLVLFGCSGSTDDTFSTSPADVVPLTLEQRIQQAAVNDPETALEVVPSDHLDAPPASVAPRGLPLLVPVADLQTSYEILFGSLSQKLGVTLTTPEVVADINFIKSQSATGNFDLNAKPILNNPLGVTAISFEPVNYQTTVPLPSGSQTFQVSGGLIMPQGITKDQVKGVVVYFHGTTTDNAAVGSQFLGNNETQLTAQVFASQGYIVVIPDYVGQGVDYLSVHPYVLYPRVSAQTAVDMLTAVQPLIASQYGFADGDGPLKLFSTGYSEGGAYSLWFSVYLSQDPGLLNAFYVLTHSVGIEGAYNTSSVTRGFIFDQVNASGSNPYNVQSQTLVNLAKPILAADAFLSYATYTLSSDFASVFSTDFFAMKATPPNPQDLANVNGQQLTIAQAFRLPSTELEKELVITALDKSSNGQTYTGFLEAPFSTSNSGKALMSTVFFTPPLQQQLQQVLLSADVDLSPVADQGVSIISLAQDSVVSPNNFDALQAAYPTKLRNAVKIDQKQLQVLSPFSEVINLPYWVPADHQNVPVYAFLYALHIFNGF